MNILIINGPNLNLLGEREPEVYGSMTLDELNHWINTHSVSQEHKLRFYQSNHEGEIIDLIHTNRHLVGAMVLNAGALTHYSYALRDAIVGSQIPTVEVHISDIQAREDFRKISVIEDVCIAQISGRGKQGYVDAIQLLTDL